MIFKSVIGIFLSILFFSEIALSGEAVKASDPCSKVEERVQCIESWYSKLQEEKTQEGLQSYFSCFPDDFNSFVLIFGYEESEKESDDVEFAPLYSNSDRYIFLLEEAAQAIPKDDFYGKMIDMSSGGEWQADAVNYLKIILQDILEEDFSGFEAVLSQKSEDSIKGFWQFYFDTAHGLKLDESVCGGGAVNGKACTVLSELVRTTAPESHSHH